MSPRPGVAAAVRRFAAGLLTGSFGRFAAVVIDLICLAASRFAARVAGRDKKRSAQ